jgi:hypothetical protein
MNSTTEGLEDIMPFDGAEEFSRREEMLAKLNQVWCLLETEEKWCKKHYRTSDGRHCLLGALMTARAKSMLYDLLLASIHDVTGVAFKSVVQFNDQPATNHAQILVVLERARRRIMTGDLPRAAARRNSLLARLMGAFAPVEA